MFYSSRLGEVPDLSLQMALDRFELGALISTERIPFGLFGQNLFITSTSGDFVFRGAPHFPWQLPTEQHFARRIHHETDVPVPWPYHLSPDSGPFAWPWGYALMSRLPGNLLADATLYAPLNQIQRANLAHAEGVLLSRLQRASCPGAGAWEVETQTMRGYPHGYVRRTHDRALASAETAFAHGGHSTKDQAWLENHLASLRDLPEPAGYTIVHEDFSRNNMTAAFTGDVVRITGLFDLMTCHCGDGLADLARQFSLLSDEPDGERLARAFVGAYLANRGQLAPVEQRRSVLYLIDERLLAWEYAKRPGHEHVDWWDRELPLRRWLEPYLDVWLNLVRS